MTLASVSRSALIFLGGLVPLLRRSELSLPREERAFGKTHTFEMIQRAGRWPLREVA